MFDEACEYILSMKGKREVQKNGKTYLEEYWIQEPNWSDAPKVKNNTNNSDLIAEMQKELEKFK